VIVLLNLMHTLKHTHTHTHDLVLAEFQFTPNTVSYCIRKSSITQKLESGLWRPGMEMPALLPDSPWVVHYSVNLNVLCVDIAENAK
jgi:hypothetical protein